MKIKIAYILLGCFMLASVSGSPAKEKLAGSEPTNLVFKLSGAGGEKWSPEETMELGIKGVAGKYASEFLPASQDPQGNWGERTNECRISIRTYATNLTVGEPLPIVFLWRNLGTSGFRFPMGGQVNYPFQLVLRRGDEVLKPEVPPIGPESPGAQWGQLIVPKGQYRWTSRLDKIYKLDRPGDYELYAERWIPDGKYWDPPQPEYPRALARSGILKFTLLPAEKQDAENSEGSSDAEPK